jgi:hypothetical protein
MMEEKKTDEVEVITKGVEKWAEKALEIIPKVNALQPKVNALQIKTEDDFKEAQALMGEIKIYIESLTDIKLGRTRLLEVAKKKITEFFNEPLQKLKDGKKILSDMMLKYEDEQEAIRKGRERIIQDQLKKKAEDNVIERAVVLDQMGEKKKAEEILERPIPTSEVSLKSSVLSSRSSHARTTWSAEVTDLMEVVRGICEGTVPINAVVPNMP